MEDVVTLDVRDDGVGLRPRRRRRRRRRRLRARPRCGSGSPGVGRRRWRSSPSPGEGTAISATRAGDRQPSTRTPAVSHARLLIVDDHPVVRDGLRGMFAGDPDFEVVGEAADGAEALAVAARRRARTWC